MTSSQSPDISNPSGFTYKLQLIFYIVALAATVLVLLVFRAASLLESSEKFAAGSIYLAVSAWDIPVLIGLPTFIALIMALVLKLVNQATEKRIQRCVHFALFFAFIAIAARFPYGYLLGSYLQQHGYSRCLPYTAPAMMSASVWVRDSRYCVTNSGSIRRQLLTWLDEAEEGNRHLRPVDVKNKANELLESSDTLERQRYPGLYD